MENVSVLIDEATGDMSFTDGEINMVSDESSILQNIRNTLLVYKGEFSKEPEHGTDYDTVFGDDPVSNEEITEIVRDAIFEEPYVKEISSIAAEKVNRQMNIVFEATLYTGETITARVVI